MGNTISALNPFRPQTDPVCSTDDIKSGFCNADPISSRGKTIQLVQMMAIPTVPTVVLVFQIVLHLMFSVRNHQQVQLSQSHVQNIISQAHLIGNLSTEKFHVSMSLYNQSIGKIPSLIEQFNSTDSALTISKWSDVSICMGNTTDEIQKVRDRALMNETASNASQIYQGTVTCLLGIISRAVKTTCPYSMACRSILGYQLFVEAIVHYRDVASLGTSYIRYGSLDKADRRSFQHHAALARDDMENSMYYSSAVRSHVTLYVISDVTANTTQNLITEVFRSYDEYNRTSLSINHTMWGEHMSSYIRALDCIRPKIEESITNEMSEKTSSTRNSIADTVGFLCVVLVLCPLVLWYTYTAMKSIQVFAKELSANIRRQKREKKKGDTLLYQMLPKSVALQLKLSKKVSAESYSAATIYFSDIVGFTAISSRSSPMQVVDFLNKLYYVFDTTIDHYDVYKVETIGDAYMVASGLPQRNGKRHAGEVAALSLELVEAIRVFTIPHLPDELIQIRIGLHTGPVAAGVVGTKMPRYCLFGDTVYVASCMESGGVPMKIQVSSDCNKALEALGGWVTEYRDVVEINGKGRMETFFLIGKTDGIRNRSRALRPPSAWGRTSRSASARSKTSRSASNLASVPLDNNLETPILIVTQAGEH